MQIFNLIEDADELAAAQKEQFSLDILTGLCSFPKYIPAKYFYDDEGSRLFQKITQQQEYYLTRTEYSILEKAQNLLPESISSDKLDIIELGVGDGHKTKILLEGFVRRGTQIQYYPIDISEKSMALLQENIQESDNLEIHGVVAEYFDGLRFVRKRSKNRQLVLFLGSNIGNFDRVQNQRFLRMLWNSLSEGDYVLLGFDLKKDIDVLTSAYNDTAGVTEAFNRNLLMRVNRELGGDFQMDRFQHFGVYNPVLGAMESYLVSLVVQQVYIAEIERVFSFNNFEPLHLESSYKYLQGDIEKMCLETGYQLISHFTDERNYFIDSLWRVEKFHK